MEEPGLPPANLPEPAAPVVESQPGELKAPLLTELSPPRSKPNRRQHLGWLGIALGMFLAVFRAWVGSYGFVPSQAIGEAIGSMLVPLLGAYLIAGRASVRNFNRFGLWFSGFSVVVFLIGRPIVPLEQHIGQLMKDAAGSQARADGPPSDIDSLVRAVMQDILALRRSLDQQKAPWNAALSEVYSAKTFSSRNEMQNSIEAVKATFAIDAQYASEIERLPDRIQKIVDSSTLSDSQKKDFMEGVRTSMANVKTLEIRREAIEKERQWTEKTLALYELAEANAAQVHVRDGKITIAGSRLLKDFNDQLQAAEVLQDQVVKLNDALDHEQQQVLGGVGLTKKDLGMDQ